MFRRRAPPLAHVVVLACLGCLPGLACRAPAGAPRRLPEPVISVGSLLADLHGLPAPREVGTPGHEQARRHLLQHLGALDLEVQQWPFRWEGRPDQVFVNLELRLPGPAPDAPVLVACAHYDTVAGSPGADDDGSGVAVLLELARRFAARPLPVELRLLFFDGEELGLVGSRAYVTALDASERARVAGVINLESVGFTDRRPDSQAMPEFTRPLLDPGTVGDFALVLANQDSSDLAAVLADALTATASGQLRVVTYDRLPGRGWLIPDSRRSDHASFWDAGIPAVMLTDTAPFRNPHYHRPSDTLATLDGEFLAAVARGVERALMVLAATFDEG